MDINSLNGYSSVSYQTTTRIETTSKNSTESESSTTDTVVREDSFVKNSTTASVTYSAPKKLTAKQVEELQNQHTESMKSMVTQMLGDQATVAQTVSGNADKFDIFAILGADATPESAAAAISEDGEWGVNAVATRLMDMAIALSGGDSSKAAELRDAVTKGFEAAGLEIGGDGLPQICKDTYDETMKRFDYWEEHGSMDGYVMGD